MTFIEQDRRSRRTRTMRFAAALMLGTAASAVAVAPAHAQQSNASLRGTITTDSGVTVTSVTAVEVATNIRRNATLSSGGAYNLPSLRAGEYRLEIVLSSGPRTTDAFSLSVAQSAQLDFDFSEGGIDSTPAAGATGDTTEANLGAEGGDVVVTGARIREMEGGEVGITISQRLIDQLPQNNRNFLAFADLAPGVQFNEDGGGNSSLRGGANSPSTINVYIDGVSQKDFILKNGITGQDSSNGNPFPQLAIGEYRVISSNYKAEFGQVGSVAITAITKSGTNRFEGEGFFDFTNQDFRAKTPAERFTIQPDGSAGTEKTETQDMQFGGALGGPIIRDTLFFFASYEGKRIRRPVDIFPGLGREISSLPQEYQGFFGQTNNVFNSDLYFGKLTFAPTSRDTFDVSAKFRDENGFGAGGGSSASETASTTNTQDLRVVGRWEHTADNWVNEFKVEYQDASWAPTPLLFADGRQFVYDGPAPGNPAVNERGTLFTIGGGGGYQDKGQKGWTLQDDFTYTGFEGHTIKVGVKSSWIELNSLQLNRFNPLYVYNPAFNPNGGTFNDDIPYQLQFGAATGSGNPIVNTKTWQFGIYAQDDWDVTDRLTLNLGLRWDYEEIPSYLDFVHRQDVVDLVTGVTTGANGQPLYPNLQNANYNIRDFISTGSEREAFMGAFQPRIGFSYQIDSDGRFVLFGGYGRSYDRNQFDFLQQEVSVGSYAIRTFNFITGDPENVCNPSATCIPFDPIYLTEAGRAQLLANAPFGGGAELRFLNNDLKTPYSDQFSLGLRTRWDDLNVEFGYSRIESKDGFVFLLGNRRPDGSFFFDNPASATDTPSSPFGFTPAGFGSIIIGDNGAETTTNTGYVKMTKAYTAASPWSFDATYTYSHAKENRLTTDQGAFSLDFPSIEDYPTVFAVGVPRHRFVAAGSVDLPIGVSLSGKFQIASPTYLRSFFSTAVPFERNIVTAEAFGNGDRWGKRQMDLAVTKYVPLNFLYDTARLRFRVDIINLFNDRNYTGYNTSFTDNTRTAASPTIYRERVGFGVGGNPPRTIKLSAGFNF